MSFKYHQDYPHGIMFHRFHDSSVPKQQGSIDSSQLENVILNIGLERILTPDEWLNRLENKSLEKHHICLTFDDALKSQKLVAEPVLRKYKLSAFYFIHSLTFFNEIDFNEVFSNIIYSEYNHMGDFMNDFIQHLDINADVFLDKKYISFYSYMNKNYTFYTDDDIKYRFLRNIYFNHITFNKILMKFFTEKKFIDKINFNSIWMDDNDILSLKNNGNIIGLHSYSHCINFKNLTYDQQKEEYDKNKSHLEKLLDCEIIAASHPLGSYNSDTLDILAKLGIKCAFRSNNTMIDYSKKMNPSSLELARVDVCDILNQLK